MTLPIVERLRAKVFAGPAEDQRLKLVAGEAADITERLYTALNLASLWITTHKPFADNAEWPACAKAISAALAKARGEQ